MPSPTDCAELQALSEGVAAARQEAELEWGAERIRILLTDEMRTKMIRQTTKWSRELQAAWEADQCTGPQMAQIRDTARAMRSMWPKLVEHVAEGGHRPLHPDVWEILLADGSVMALVRTDDEAAKVLAEGRHLRVLTAAEIANVWEALPDALQVAKIEFPGARFTGSSDRSWVAEGDPIPFGDAA